MLQQAQLTQVVEAEVVDLILQVIIKGLVQAQAVQA